MNSVFVKDILTYVNGTLLFDETGMTEEEAKLHSVSFVITDSRQGCENSLFVPLPGETFDGHDFIKDVYQRGTRVVFTARGIIEKETKDCVYICVKDTLIALQDLGAAIRKQFLGTIIGITGSVGKTTTKEMISQAVSPFGKVLKTFGNRNGQIGVPLMMLELTNDYDIAVIEMGMSLPGEMERLAKIVKPDIAVMTNIGLAHIGQLGSKENILTEKLHICSQFEDDKGILLVNGEDEWLNRVEEYLPKKKPIRTVRFGFSKALDYYADAVETRENETAFTFMKRGETKGTSVIIPTIGMHNVIDAVSAMATAVELAKSYNSSKDLQNEAKAANCLRNYETQASRGRVETLGRLTLIDDTYNASPASMLSGVDMVENLTVAGRKIIVLADVLELGEQSKKYHYQVGESIAKKQIDCLITIGEEAKEIAKAVWNLTKKIEVITCNTRDEAFLLSLSKLHDGDLVYLKGSHGMRLDLLAQQIRETYRTDTIHVP